MKRPTLFIICLLAYALPLAAEVREKVFIVRPNIIASTKDMLLEKSRLWQNVNNDRSEWYARLAEGGHGSGFLYVDANGDNFIITNRHVVAHADSAEVIMRDGDREFVYSFCPIVYISDSADIAILTFPGREQHYQEGFEPDFELPKDGQDVISAGFPGYGDEGRALWQFARGYITNRKAVLDELSNHETPFFIQHSANIDGGNSGGPLLVEGTEPGEYRVVGVNTFTLRDRDNTFFTIPTDVVARQYQKMIVILSGVNPGDSAQALEEACKEFASMVNDKEKEAADYRALISEDYVSRYGLNLVLDILEDSSTPESERLRERFSERPWETMRLVATDGIRGKLHADGEMTYIGSEGFQAYAAGESGEVDTEFRCGERNVRINWKFRFGRWRITDIAMGEAVASVRQREGREERNKDPRKSFSEWLAGLKRPDSINNAFCVYAGFPYSATQDLPLGTSAGLISIMAEYSWYPSKFPIYLSCGAAYSIVDQSFSPWVDATYHGGLKIRTSAGLAWEWKRMRIYGGGGLALNWGRFTLSNGVASFHNGSGVYGEAGIQLFMGERKRTLIGYEFSIEKINGYNPEPGMPKSFYSFDNSLGFGYRW